MLIQTLELFMEDTEKSKLLKKRFSHYVNLIGPVVVLSH